MDTVTVAIALSVAGGICEIGGVVIVALAVYNAFISQRKATDAELDQAFMDLQEEAIARDRDLREGLRHVLAGGTRGAS